MRTGVINTSQKEVLEYLKARQGRFVSPSEVGDELHPMVYPGNSAWACPRLKRLVEEGLVERNEKGWYRAVQEGEKPC